MKKLFINIIVFATLFLGGNRAYSAVTSVQLTPATPTNMSTGAGFYLAGKTYTFDVRVIDPAGAFATGATVGLIIPSATNIDLQVSGINATGVYAITVNGGAIDTTISTATVAGTTNDFTISFDVRIAWNTAERAWAAGTISATSGALTDNQVVSYGVTSSINILTGSFDGVGADGYINPQHTAFNMNAAELVYNIPGAAAADAVDLLADSGAGEITGNTDLLQNGIAIGGTAVDADESNGLVYLIPAASITTLGNRTITVRAAMTTTGGPVTTSNSLTINCDRVQVTNIQFVGGGGIDSPYYRCIQVTGTRIRVTAQMQNAGTGMLGNTYVRITDAAESIDYDVFIPNGQNTAEIAIDNSVLTVPGAAHTTTVHSYTATAIYGGLTDDEQTNFTLPVNVDVYWDYADPPGVGAALFNGGGHTASSTPFSITMGWDPLVASLGVDEDFYSYKIYYRVAGSSEPWTVVDRNTSGFGAGGYDLQLITTGSCDISNLIPLTSYEYWISAVDVFGNEVLIAHRISDIANTGATSITVSLGDGFVSYADATFTADAAATARPVKVTGIKVGVRITGTPQLPDVVTLIVAQDGATDLITSGAITTGLVENTDYYRVVCSKSGANDWTGYISESLPIMTDGQSVRFIVELAKGVSVSYADHDNEIEVAPGNPNDYEWNFSLTNPTLFTPTPVKILNNVITSGNPIAYPTYYLSDEAYVSIKVYDVKGRLLIVLLDDAIRPAGRNIKENGWRGTNKAGKKLGVGLYYVKFKAKRSFDGKVILNSVKKVVVAK